MVAICDESVEAARLNQSAMSVVTTFVDTRARSARSERSERSNRFRRRVDDEVGGYQARSARSERSERSNQMERSGAHGRIVRARHVNPRLRLALKQRCDDLGLQL